MKSNFNTICFLFVLLAYANFGNAQYMRSGEFIIFAAIANADVYNQNGISSDSYNVRGTYMFGIKQSKPISRLLDIQGGIYIMRSKVNYKAFWTRYSKNVTLLSVPLLLNINANRSLYFNAGLSIDAQLGEGVVDVYDGIGLELAGGYRLPLEGLNIHISPYFRRHKLFVFVKSGDGHMTDFGLRAGISFDHKRRQKAIEE